MKFPIRKSMLLASLAALLIGGSGAVGGGARRLGGHLPQKQMAKARHLGRHAPHDRLRLAVSLHPKDPQGLAELVSALYNPEDPRYHQFLSPAQFRERYAPSDEDVAKVTGYLESRGLSVKGVHENNLVVNVQASAGEVENALGVELHDYRTADGRVAFAATSEPLFLGEAGEKVLAVTGLHNFTRYRSPHRHQGARLDPAALSGRAAIGDYMTPTKVRKAYGLDAVSSTGSGETLALFQLDGYNASDINSYASYFGLAVPTLQNVLVDGVSGAAGSDTEEVCLDIELAMAMAPGLAKIMVYEGPNTDSGVLNTYSRIANDNIAKVVSSSWGAPEDTNTVSFRNSENTIFQQMAAQGQSLFVASGDNGAYDDTSNTTKLEVDDPASQPYVTAVGGTTLTANATTGAYGSETSWGTSSNGLGGGGGVSTIWALPQWQANLATVANKGSLTMRMVPDVSLDANPSTGYPVYTKGAWYAFGGTSAAAPLWAAFAAVVNQGRVANGVARLGFANPALYQIAQSSLYASTFHDIADGSTNLYYPAVVGYDLSTGLGTMNGPGLYNVLAGGVLPPSAPTAITLVAGPASLTVNWSGGSGASQYKVYRSSSSNGPFAVIATVAASTTNYTDNASSGVNYYYVKAVNSAGESAASRMEAGAAGQSAPGAPTGLTGVLQ